MEYLETADLIYINQTQVGPDFGVRDPGLLESALLRPQQVVFGVELYPDVHTKAAALTEALTQYHVFGDGNKRTALLADIAFYGLNGYRLEVPHDRLYKFILGIATHRYESVDDIARVQSGWTRRVSKP